MLSSLYKKTPHNAEKKLREAIAQGLANGTGQAQIFFRADDIGIPGQQFSKLIQLFRKYKLPLCLAVVPTWITEDRSTVLLDTTGKTTSQWCWHQHGWLHRNYEMVGKKQEFGPARSGKDQIADLRKGKERLSTILGANFSPFFTPPWNRCSQDTLEGLHKLAFHAVSRSANAKPMPPANLLDIQINIDLHTRKEAHPEKCFKDLLTEITEGIIYETGGIMIHHQRMNQAAFDFLDLLLHTIHTEPKLHPVLFQELL
jgi:peptidoglycan/xylan/chitin deacetylase (PgdA/CDA1 family)